MNAQDAGGALLLIAYFFAGVALYLAIKGCSLRTVLYFGVPAIVINILAILVALL